MATRHLDNVKIFECISAQCNGQRARCGSKYRAVSLTGQGPV